VPHSTILTPPASYRIAIWAALPGLGAVIGWVVLTFRDDWLAQDWLPMRGPVLLIDRVADWLGPAAPVVLIGLGLAAGVLLALTAAGEEVTLTVTDDRVSIARAGSLRHHRRVDVREALLEGSHLVLVAENGTELARVRTEIPHAALAAAFAAHGYTWAA
jgi:hypothetical protein